MKSGIERVVVIGAGQAALQAAETLRRKAFRDSIVLIGEEPVAPYQRPPLSKAFLAGRLEPERLLLRAVDTYAEQQIDMRLNTRCLEIDRGAARIHLADGASIVYDALIIATGSHPRRLEIPGARAANVCVLRSKADAIRIREHMRSARRLVIIGGGYIGLEVAATCREQGLDVTILEVAGRLMSRVVCDQMSAFFEAEHRTRGAQIECGVEVSEILTDASGNAFAVRCAPGREYPADLVLIGAGAIPSMDLAKNCGIECSNGIVIDEQCRTSDQRIYAAGDCAVQPSERYGCRVRLESVDNAIEQGTHAAIAILDLPAPEHKTPWFWSDQYDVKLVTVGLNHGYDTALVRGNPSSRAFSVCYLRGGELIAVDTINNAKDHMAARKLIAARVRPHVDRLLDVSRPLKECI